MSTFSLRPLQAADRAGWEPLWQGYLAFYEITLPADVTATTWARLNDEAEPMHGIVAEREGALLGIVHYLFHRSTSSVADYCYLQDLFTAPEARGHGVGRALIEAVYERAQAAGASRVYWHTHESNATARALYDRVATRTGFIHYRGLV